MSSVNSEKPEINLENLKQIILNIFRGPENTAAIFWGSGALAILTILPMEPWNKLQLGYLLVAEIFALTATILRATHQQWAPKWSTSVGVVVGTIGIGGLVWITNQYSMNLSVLFIWIAIYSALNFSLKSSMYLIGFEGIVYGVVLFLTHGSAPIERWLQIMGTSTVAGGTVSLLVSELRIGANQDALTKLPNRRQWNEKLNEELERAKRNSSCLSVAMIDIDGMKEINDERGHLAGDDVLKTIGSKWAPLMRKGTLIARIGGDEFAAIAPDSTKEDLELIVMRLSQATPEISFSVGIAEWNYTEGLDELLNRADHNMYKMKSGRSENHKDS